MKKKYIYQDSESGQTYPAMQESKEATHTPTPWKVDDDRGSFFITRDFSDPGLMPIAECVYTKNYHESNKETALANAAFIVRAVNSHEALIAFVRSMLDDEILVCVKEDTGDDGCYHCDAKKLIAQSEKGE